MTQRTYIGWTILSLGIAGLTACQSHSYSHVKTPETDTHYGQIFATPSPEIQVSAVSESMALYNRYAQIKSQTTLMACLRAYQFTGSHSVCQEDRAPQYAKSDSRVVPQAVTRQRSARRLQQGPRRVKVQTQKPAYEGPRQRPDFLTSNLQGQSLRPTQFERPVQINGQGMGLRGLMQATREYNPTLEIERLRVQEVEENQVQAKALSRPTIGIEASSGLRQSDTSFTFDARPSQSETRPLAGVQAFISQPLYQGGKAKAMRGKTHFDSQVAKEKFNGVEDGVMFSASQVYLEILRDRKSIEIYERNISGLVRQESIISRLMGAGEATMSDMARVQSRLAAARIDLSRAKAEAQTRQSEYRNLVGRAPDTNMQMPSLYEPNSVLEVKTAAQNNNPEILASQHRIDAAHQAIKLAKADGKPTASLQGLVRGSNGQSQTIRSDSAAELLLNISVPLYSGGSNKSKLRQSKLAHSRTLLEARTVQQDIFKNIDQKWSNLQSAKHVYSLSLTQSKTAQTAYKSVKRENEVGVSTLTDVLLADEQWLKSQLNVVMSDYAIQQSKLELLYLMGRL